MQASRPTADSRRAGAFGILQVEAGREGLGRAGQDDHRGFEIVLEVARHVAQLAHRLPAEGIDVVAAVEAHDGDAALRAQPFSTLTKLPLHRRCSSRVRRHGSASALQARAAWLDCVLMSKSIASIALERRIDALFARYTKPGSPGAVVAVMRGGEHRDLQGLWPGQHRARRADRRPGRAFASPRSASSSR